MTEHSANDETLLDLGERSLDEIKELLDRYYEEEQRISYRRRVLHGKIDILRAEVVRRLKADRETGDSIVSGDEIHRLVDILSTDLRGVSRFDVTADDYPEE